MRRLALALGLALVGCGGSAVASDAPPATDAPAITTTVAEVAAPATRAESSLVIVAALAGADLSEVCPTFGLLPDQVADQLVENLAADGTYLDAAGVADGLRIACTA